MVNVMAAESPSGADGGLPFKDAPEAAPRQAESIPVPLDPTELSLRSSAADLDASTQPSFDEMIGYLGKGFDVLSGLNLQGFQQIYPVFLAILAAVATGLVIVILSNILISINHFPLIGGLLERLFELCGLVVVARFAASNLLLQKKRAELFLRIAELKKKLIGQ